MYTSILRYSIWTKGRGRVNRILIITTIIERFSRRFYVSNIGTWCTYISTCKYVSRERERKKSYDVPFAFVYTRARSNAKSTNCRCRRPGRRRRIIKIHETKKPTPPPFPFRSIPSTITSARVRYKRSRPVIRVIHVRAISRFRRVPRFPAARARIKTRKRPRDFPRHS